MRVETYRRKDEEAEGKGYSREGKGPGSSREVVYVLEDVMGHKDGAVCEMASRGR